MTGKNYVGPVKYLKFHKRQSTTLIFTCNLYYTSYS